MNHVHSTTLTRPLLPDISPLPSGLFSTSTGLSWYHASIVPLPVSMFNIPMGLLAFIELPCFKFLLSIDPLLVGLFSTPLGLFAFIELPYFKFLLSIDPLPPGLFSTLAGFPCIMILSIWKPIGTRAC